MAPWQTRLVSDNASLDVSAQYLFMNLLIQSLPYSEQPYLPRYIGNIAVAAPAIEHIASEQRFSDVGASSVSLEQLCIELSKLKVDPGKSKY
jgi:hypothetical protein